MLKARVASIDEKMRKSCQKCFCKRVFNAPVAKSKMIQVKGEINNKGRRKIILIY